MLIVHVTCAAMATFRLKAKRKAEVERMKQLIVAQNKEKAEKEKLARKNKGKGSATKPTFTVNKVNTKLNANAAGTAGGTSKTSVLLLRLRCAPAVLGCVGCRSHHDIRRDEMAPG